MTDWLQTQANTQEQLQFEAAEGAEPAEATESAAPTAEEVHAELLPVLQEAVQQHGQGGHTLMAVTMLCMLPEYESRAADFLQPLFGEYPNKVWCPGIH